jgi:Glycosyltransferase family 43
LAFGFYQHSVVYFMEENCAYSLELFDEMAKIRPGRVGVWPIGLTNGRLVQAALLDSAPEAGYAVSADLLLRATGDSLAERLQLLAGNGTRVLVWRVQTEAPLLLNSSLENFFRANKL